MSCWCRLWASGIPLPTAAFCCTAGTQDCFLSCVFLMTPSLYLLEHFVLLLTVNYRRLCKPDVFGLESSWMFAMFERRAWLDHCDLRIISTLTLKVLQCKKQVVCADQLLLSVFFLKSLWLWSKFTLSVTCKLSVIVFLLLFLKQTCIFFQFISVFFLSDRSSRRLFSSKTAAGWWRPLLGFWQRYKPY